LEGLPDKINVYSDKHKFPYFDDSELFLFDWFDTCEYNLDNSTLDDLCRLEKKLYLQFAVVIVSVSVCDFGLPDIQ